MVRWLFPLAALLSPAAALAQSPRDLLIQAAFEDRTKAPALAKVERARTVAAATADRAPNDQEAVVVGATALGYRAKLTGSRSEALAARRAFEAAAARFPRNAEAQLALGAWHLGIIEKVGRLVGRAAMGAQKGVGLAAIDRAVALGGDRAMFMGLAALLRLQADPADPRARALVERAARAPTPTAIDRYMQRAATSMLAPLRTGDTKAVRALADRSLPFGWFRG
jgi:hypothetical protein